MSTEFQKLPRAAREEKEREIVSTVLNGNLTYREVAEETGVNIRTVQYLMGKFAKSTNVAQQMSRKVSANPTPEDYAALQREVERLRKELRHEKMRADVNSTMVDVAEEMFGIQIRKKAGTK